MENKINEDQNNSTTGEKKERHKVIFSQRINPESTSFLLIEYQSLFDLWKQYDTRNENNIKFYFTIVTILISITAVVLNFVGSTELSLPIVIVLTFILLISSVLFLIRIVKTALRKKEYLKSIDLIRQYFIDKDEILELYMLRPGISKLDLEFESLYKEYSSRATTVSILAFYSWICILGSLFCMSLFFLLSGNLETIFPIGITSFITCAGIIYLFGKLYLRKEIRRINRMVFKVE